MLNYTCVIFAFYMLSLFNASAADFTPTPMTITVPSQIEYNFGGSTLEIPFTLTGKSGAIWLVINTHGQAENIKAVRNGYLGWHYVNKIDTTIYISQKFERTPGENTITWDGKDENGNIPIEGTYDYFLWGYDNKSSRTLVSDYIRSGCNAYNQQTKLYEKDEQGMPLAKPMLMGNVHRADVLHYTDSFYRNGTNFKWVIGANPMDKSLIQTTICSIYSWQDEGENADPIDWIAYGGSGFDPKDYNIFYQPTYLKFPYEGHFGIYYRENTSIFKWQFVTGGEAVLDSDWFGWDYKSWETGAYWSYNSCETSNNYIYVADSDPSSRIENNTIKCIDYDGNIVFDKTFHEWYIPNSNASSSWNNSIDKIYTHNANRMFLLSAYSCMHQMINPSRLYEDPDDETDMVLFTNSNGDYFMDNGWNPDITLPWFCVSSGYLPYYDDVPQNTQVKTGVAVDSNDLNIIFVSNYGIVSFGVSTQDGTGIGYMSFADDRADISCAGGLICDNNSAYDGIYFSDIAETFGFSIPEPKTYYNAFDSAHGLITNEMAVETKNPLQFKVNQNTPNPFNPTTSISFTIPEKGNVSIDIYNIAGQKVKTLVNGYMNAGEHSVRWDAGGCSAGVYFFKVKAGKFERTMRMTLVR